jgi:cytochrome P450
MEGVVARPDFSYVTDPALRSDGHAEWDRLREEGRAIAVCPASSAFAPPAHPEQTTWHLLRYDDIFAAYRDHRLFSSRGAQGDPNFIRLPIDLDPPEHALYRRLVNPLLSPVRVREWEPMMRARCRTLVEGFVGDGECEFVSQFAYGYAPTISMITLGLPLDDAEQFLAWNDQARMGRLSDTVDEIRQAQANIAAYLTRILRERAAEPRDDLISQLLTGEIGGRPLEPDELVRLYTTLFAGGLDTVASAVTYMFAHLATHPDDRAQLSDDPELVPNAVEELLRVYSIAANERLVTEDAEFASCPMKKGDRVVLSTLSANRDPRVFPDADRVDLTRAPTKHLAFGAGPHRCVGSHLARLELRVALEEWHALLPDYRLAESAVLTHFAGTAARFERLPLVWD